jgi:hypothetical protein
MAMAFPDDADLGVRAEINAGTWVDITSDLRTDQPVTITRGRSDWSQQVSPTKVAAKIRNPVGDYSPRNPTGRYYGQLGRNTALRTSVAAGSPWLGLQPPGVDVRASTPSTSDLNITGDLDLRFDVAPFDYNSLAGVVELVGKWGAAGQRSWECYLFAGTIRFGWTIDGTTEILAVAPLNDTELRPRIVLRITMDVDNGAGGHTVRFYAGTSINGSTWVQIGGDNIFSGTSSTFASTAPLELGDVSALALAHVPARLFAAQLRNGIDGTIVASPDFTVLQPGTMAFTDSVGRAWSVNRSDGVTNRMVRGIGAVPDWPPEWGPSGRLVTASLEAAGIRRRLGQGASPLQSTLRRRIPSDPTVIAYWPMEEGASATQAYSPLPRVKPMATSGMQFASDDTLPGSSALPTLGAVSSMSGTVPSSSTGEWRVEFVYRIDTAPAGDFNAQLIIVNTSTAQWRIGIGATTLHLDVTGLDGTSLVVSAIVPIDFFGSWSRFILQAQQSGTSVAYTVEWTSIGGGSQAVGGSYTGSVGHVRSLTASHGNGLQGMPVGHFTVFNDSSASAFDNADKGFAGEDVATRAIRLTGEEAVPLIVPWGTIGTERMGAQRPDTLLNLLQQGADADENGILFEPRDAIALAFRPRRSLYNQPPALVLDYAAGQVAPPLEPVDDDQQVRNDITVTRTGGSSGTATLDVGPLSTADPEDGGVGRYTDSVTENLYDDDQPDQHAAWRLHLGTYDAMRFPVVTIYLHRCPELIDQAREVDIGDRIQIINPPPWLPPGALDLIVQGITEVPRPRTWTMSFNCTPGGPWTVAALDDHVLGRADTDGSQLAAAVTATDTLLPVTVTAGPLWVTTASNAAEFPFDIRVGGEVMTVTGIGGSVVDAYGRTVASGWGTTDTGQAWTTSGGSAGDFTVQGV